MRFFPSGQSHPRHAWIDASAGVAGDMLLASLVDLGADLSSIQASVDAVLPDTVRLVATEVVRAGLRARKVDVEVLVDDQPHREWTAIRQMVEHAELPDEVRQAVLATFEALAVAEGRVHGIDPASVHFHEVGAWDSIADVVGVCAGFHLLSVDTVSAGPIAVGSGRIPAAHGDLPLPVPAVLELSTGWKILAGGSGELATPTGVALIRSIATSCEPLPELRVEATGIGAGTKDVPDRANVLRVVLGTKSSGTGRVADGGSSLEQLRVLEANIDDLDPRIWPDVLAKVMEAGAADAWLTPILMKKGRPAHKLSILCHEPDVQRLRDLAFSLTSTFGIRDYAVSRVGLQREWRSVHVAGEVVRVKLSLDAERRILHATPELDDATAAAGRAGLPLRQVLIDADAAVAAAGLVRGAMLRADST